MTTRYFPIEVSPRFLCTASELYDLRHSYAAEGGGNPLVAYFSLPDPQTSFLKISFTHADIVRVLDETYLSTEEYGVESVGLVPFHFAYRIEGSRFWNSQSEFYRDSRRDAVHYRFITGGACLDVLTTVEPEFEIISSAAFEAAPFVEGKV
ncbi:hypothetical protein [Rhizobium sp. YS-1r]|uniref:hypothetical protein n=1 Tax=Rhizobium sp. YS-1r TaxID=1532558 RepID=UPI00068A25B1|nr:hypothetical protein [Rhizobium sp. YS-1r]